MWFGPLSNVASSERRILTPSILFLSGCIDVRPRSYFYLGSRLPARVLFNYSGLVKLLNNDPLLARILENVFLTSELEGQVDA